MGALSQMKRPVIRWAPAIAVLIVAAACSPSSTDTDATAGGTGNDVPAATASALQTAAERAELGVVVDVVDAGIADLQVDAPPRETPSPSQQAIIDALAGSDWAEILDGADPGAIASRVERVMRGSTLPVGASEQVGALEESARWVPKTVRARPKATLISRRLRLDPVREERTVSDGSKSGTVSVEVDVEFDESSGRETTTITMDGDVTDSESGERTIAHSEGESYRDVCWGEDGARESGSTTATTVTTESPGGSETTEQSRTTTVRRGADGSVTIGVSVTVGDYTVGYTSGSSDDPRPEGERLSDDGDQYTYTTTTEDGETTVSVDKDATWSDDGLQEALDELADSDKLQDDMESAKEALEKPLSPSSPGSDEFCLKLSIDPTSASLEADGDPLPIKATLLDWSDRPVVSAIVTADGARLGSIAPKLGPTATDGVWTTTYTSGDPGTETLAFEAARFGYNVQRTMSIDIGSGLAFDWSRSQGAQTATVSATSCDGTSWSGDFSFQGSPGGAEISMSATFGLQVDGGTGETQFVSIGTIGTAGEHLPIEMPYSMTITVDGEARTADVQIDRLGGGVVVAEGRRLPIPTEGFPEFVFSTPLDTPTDCG